MNDINKSLYGLIISIFIYFFIWFLVPTLTVEPDSFSFDVYLTMFVRILWYIDMFIFLQSSVVIHNKRYNEKEATLIFYIQILFIIMSEIGNYSKILNSV